MLIIEYNLNIKLPSIIHPIIMFKNIAVFNNTRDYLPLCRVAHRFVCNIIIKCKSN